MARLRSDSAASTPAPTQDRLPPIYLGKDPGEVPVTKQRAPFLLAFHPTRWSVSGKRLLPSLRTIRLQGGTNGVRQRKDGTYDVSGLHENLTQSGWTILDLRLGYCVESTPGSGDWIPKWGTVLPDGSVRENEKQYLDWVACLVEDGTLPAASLENARSAQGQLHNIAAQAQKLPEPSAKAVAAQIEAIDAVVASLEGAE